MSFSSMWSKIGIFAIVFFVIGLAFKLVFMFIGAFFGSIGHMGGCIIADDFIPSLKSSWFD